MWKLTRIRDNETFSSDYPTLKHMLHQLWYEAIHTKNVTFVTGLGRVVVTDGRINDEAFLIQGVEDR